MLFGVIWILLIQVAFTLAETDPWPVVPSDVLFVTVLDPTSSDILRDAFSLLRSYRFLGGRAKESVFLVCIVVKDELSYLDGFIYESLVGLGVEIAFIHEVSEPFSKTLNKFKALEYAANYRDFHYYIWLDADIIFSGDPMPLLKVHEMPGRIECVPEFYNYLIRYSELNESSIVFNSAMPTSVVFAEDKLAPQGICNTGVLYLSRPSLKKLLAGLPAMMTRILTDVPYYAADRFFDSLLFVAVTNSAEIEVSFLPVELNYMVYFRPEMESMSIETPLLLHFVAETSFYCLLEDIDGNRVVDHPRNRANGVVSCRCALECYDDGGKAATALEYFSTVSICGALAGVVYEDSLLLFGIVPYVEQEYEVLAPPLVSNEPTCVLHSPIAMPYTTIRIQADRWTAMNNYTIEVLFECASLELSNHVEFVATALLVVDFFNNGATAEMSDEGKRTNLIVERFADNTIQNYHYASFDFFVSGNTSIVMQDNSRSFIRVEVLLDLSAYQDILSGQTGAVLFLNHWSFLNPQFEGEQRTLTSVNRLLTFNIVNEYVVSSLGVRRYGNNVLRSRGSSIQLSSALNVGLFLNQHKAFHHTGYFLCCTTIKSLKILSTLVSEWKGDMLVVMPLQVPFDAPANSNFMRLLNASIAEGLDIRKGKVRRSAGLKLDITYRSIENPYLPPHPLSVVVLDCDMKQAIEYMDKIITFSFNATAGVPRFEGNIRQNSLSFVYLDVFLHVKMFAKMLPFWYKRTSGIFIGPMPDESVISNVSHINVNALRAVETFAYYDQRSLFHAQDKSLWYMMCNM